MAAAAASTQPPRLLQLGVKLLPLPQHLGSSYLLAISPHVVLLNRTSSPLQCCQRGMEARTPLACDVDGWVPIHWESPQKPKELLLRRVDRGSEWSGGVSVNVAAAAGAGPCGPRASAPAAA